MVLRIEDIRSVPRSFAQICVFSRIMELMRLQKFLSAAGFSSRRQGEEYIKNGRVKVNGIVVAELKTKVDPDTERVEVWTATSFRSIRNASMSL